MTWGVVLGQYYVSLWATKYGRFSTTHAFRSKQHTISLMWRINVLTSFKHSINFKERSPLDIRKSNVRLCCSVYLLISGHPTNVTYGALLITVNGVRRGVHYSAIILILRATVAKYTMPSICKCCCNINVTCCWVLLYTRYDGVLLSCVSFLRIPQIVCKSICWRQISSHQCVYVRCMDCSGVLVYIK